jgi:pimeloyl-ACP methyl ester carboxylesterase
MHPVRWTLIALAGVPVLLFAIGAVGALSGNAALGRNALRWARTVIFAEVVFLIVVALGGTIWEITTSTRMRRLYPPPGKLVDVNGSAMHLYCLGQGHPTVVLDFGLVGSYLDWYRVQPEVARFTRVCSYDRAGYGWSDARSEPRTADYLAEELHSLLVQAGEKPPYVLVAHSASAFTARVFARQYGKEVAGMVLVDGSHPDEEMPFRRQDQWRLRLLQVTAPLGLPRWRQWCAGGPDDIRELRQATDCRSQFFATYYETWAGFAESARQARELPGLGNLPLAVVSRDPKKNGPHDQGWQKMQEELTTLSSDSTHVIAEGSGHAVMWDRPDVVAAAIREVVGKARKR